MRRVDRSLATEPPILGKRDRHGRTELDRVNEHMNGPDHAKPFDFSRYRERSVKAELERLFHGKCAYCESFYGSTQPVDVEHYRPKGEVEGIEDHPGYYWLAMDWQNLLPSCIDCNRRREQKAPNSEIGTVARLLTSGEFDRSRRMSLGKASAFPLATEAGRAKLPGEPLAAEHRLLLDPTRDDPREHLTFFIDRENLIGLVFPKAMIQPIATAGGEAPVTLVSIANRAGVSPMGLASIQIYGLNRLGLVQARTKILRDLEFLLELSICLAEVAEEIDQQIARKSVLLNECAASQREDIEADIGFMSMLRRRMDAFKKDALSQLRQMAEPSKPYSELVRSWLAAYLV